MKLTINAKGLENALRGEEDGICFFGIEEKKDVLIFLNINFIIRENMLMTLF